MDQVKIGKYIAEKRKAMGLTQVELADKLGMSNKSVSKWERGVCLPDVSLYSELCNILGISINEFLAGEDIEPENIAKKSEETIISVTEHGNKKSRRFKGLSIALAVLAVVICIVFAWFLNKEGYFIKNYLRAYDYDSEEYRAATMLVPGRSVNIYYFSTDLVFNQITVKYYTYKDGKLTETDNSGVVSMPRGDSDKRTEGNIGLILNAYGNELETIINTEYEATSLFKEVLKSAEAEEFYNGIISSQPKGIVKIEEGKEIPICMYRISEEYQNSGASLEEAFEDPEAVFANDAHDIIVTVTFGFGLNDRWFQTPSVSPVETVKSAIEGQIEKEYTITVRIEEIEEDSDATERAKKLYLGSDLAKGNGWSDEYIESNMVVVRAEYYVEYDHEKTFRPDGNIKQFFILLRNEEMQEWEIWDSTTNEDPFS